MAEQDAVGTLISAAKALPVRDSEPKPVNQPILRRADEMAFVKQGRFTHHLVGLFPGLCLKHPPGRRRRRFHV